MSGGGGGGATGPPPPSFLPAPMVGTALYNTKECISVNPQLALQSLLHICLLRHRYPDEFRMTLDPKVIKKWDVCVDWFRHSSIYGWN